MNLLDYALIALVAISVVMAALRGFVYEVWMMAATLIAIAIAAWQYPALAPWFRWLGGEPATNFAAFVAVVAIVMLVAMMAGRFLRGSVRAVGLGGLDRLLGAGLGLFRGLLLGAALVLILTAYPLRPHWVRGSRLAPDFLWASRALAAVVPQHLAGRFHAAAQQWQ